MLDIIPFNTDKQKKIKEQRTRRFKWKISNQEKKPLTQENQIH